jgi:phosphoglycerate-specific signal transduction histidine kinase
VGSFFQIRFNTAWENTLSIAIIFIAVQAVKTWTTNHFHFKNRLNKRFQTPTAVFTCPTAAWVCKLAGFKRPPPKEAQHGRAMES